MDLLSSEALRYSDVVILNVTDNPRGSNTDIAFKAFAALEWAAASFPEAFRPFHSAFLVCFHAV
jgi:hypothetical protein